MKTKFLFDGAFLSGFLLLCTVNLYAENIDPCDDSSQYAYGENIGWVNFEPNRPEPNVGATVSDHNLTGFIWSETIGWINLDPVFGGVTNDGAGNLSGYAWSENAGWISFSCENTASCGTVDYGVTIGSDGEFDGYAWGENIGWIHLASPTPVPYKVQTAWTPSQIPPTCEPNIPADVSGDCRVDFNDFAIIAADWLKPQDWVARYNGPYNYYDAAFAIAADNAGNVYVTGRSYGSGADYDYATIKYNSDGNELWVARYNGPGNDYDGARAIALDNAGNVYVTGSSYGAATYEDYATIKYNSDGNEVWVARYNGPYHFFPRDEALAIAVDDAGNVYVTGQSRSPGVDYDYGTIKYNSDGNEVWVARYNGPGDDDDVANAIALDNDGNAYVTGGSCGSGTASDYATIKYNSDGNEVNEVWVARYNAPANDFDRAYSLALDNVGNVYVTGYSYAAGTDYDYATIKYNSDGNEVWVARYNGPGNDWDIARAIAVDDTGNAYVTGESEGAGTLDDYTTVKYDTDGNELWVARYNGPGNAFDNAYDIALDDTGNVYVTGYSDGSGTYADYATIRYDAYYGCTPQLTGDFNHDCQVNFADIKIFCDYWLECNLDPPEACWE